MMFLSKLIFQTKVVYYLSSFINTKVNFVIDHYCLLLYFNIVIFTNTFSFNCCPSDSYSHTW